MSGEHSVRIGVSLSSAGLADLDRLASGFGMTRSAVVRYAVRVAGGGSGQVEQTQGSDEELLLHNLVATEQVIKLLERFLPGGAAATAEVLPLAVGAAQLRIGGPGGAAR